MRKNAHQGRRAFTLIELLIVMVVLATLASIALPNYVQSRKAANEVSAIASMRTLISAEENYRIARNPSTYGFLADLKTAGMLHDALKTGSKTGYTFLTFGTPDGTSYAFIGKPQTNAGDRWFYVDQTGVIRYEESAQPNASSPPLQ